MRRHPPSFIEQRFWRYEPGHQADLQRALRINGLPHEQHLHAPAPTNDARKPSRGTTAGDDPQLALRGRKARVGRSDAQVAAQRHLKTATHADTINGRNGGFRRALELISKPLHNGFQRLAKIAVQDLGQVRSRRECAVARTRDGDYANLIVLGCSARGVLQLRERGKRNRVVFVRAVDGNQRHRAFDLVQDVLVHGCFRQTGAAMIAERRCRPRAHRR